MIADEAQAVADIRAFLNDGWGEATPVVYDDQNEPPTADKPWCRLTIRHVDGDQKTMGAPGRNRHQQDGFAILQIFTPQGDASLKSQELMARATKLFRGKDTPSGIHFYKTTPREKGSDGRGFYQVNVTVLFRYDLFA